MHNVHLKILLHVGTHWQVEVILGAGAKSKCCCGQEVKAMRSLSVCFEITARSIDGWWKWGDSGFWRCWWHGRCRRRRCWRWLPSRLEMARLLLAVYYQKISRIDSKKMAERYIGTWWMNDRDSLPHHHHTKITKIIKKTSNLRTIDFQSQFLAITVRSEENRENRKLLYDYWIFFPNGLVSTSMH